MLLYTLEAFRYASGVFPLEKNEEENIYTYSEVIKAIRNKLKEYFRGLAHIPSEPESIESTYESFILSFNKGVVNREKWFPERVGVVDGGSSVISLNIGYIGIAVALGLIIDNNRVTNRVFIEPEIVPCKPSEIHLYESIEVIESIIDKIRESLVFETCLKLLENNLDLLVIDGPLIPFGALAKITIGSLEETNALMRYRSSVSKLHESLNNRDTSLIGFVKRPRSRYLANYFKLNSFDHVFLSNIVKPGEYYPDPPVKYDERMIHDESIAYIVKVVEPSFTYMRFTYSTPPYRIDFGSLKTSYRNVLSYLYHNRTREGIPYIVMKADEEAKITRKLIRDLYEDVLHDIINEYVRHNRASLVPLLPEYGWY